MTPRFEYRTGEGSQIRGVYRDGRLVMLVPAGAFKKIDEAHEFGRQVADLLNIHDAAEKAAEGRFDPPGSSS